MNLHSEQILNPTSNINVGPNGMNNYLLQDSNSARILLNPALNKQASDKASKRASQYSFITYGPIK